MYSWGLVLKCNSIIDTLLSIYSVISTATSVKTYPYMEIEGSLVVPFSRKKYLRTKREITAVIYLHYSSKTGADDGTIRLWDLNNFKCSLICKFDVGVIPKYCK